VDDFKILQRPVALTPTVPTSPTMKHGTFWRCCRDPTLFSATSKVGLMRSEPTGLNPIKRCEAGRSFASLGTSTFLLVRPRESDTPDARGGGIGRRGHPGQVHFLKRRRRAPPVREGPMRRCSRYFSLRFPKEKRASWGELLPPIFRSRGLRALELGLSMTRPGRLGGHRISHRRTSQFALDIVCASKCAPPWEYV